VDPDCDVGTVCSRLGVCCPNDRTCDIVRCPTGARDPDCTNTDFCRRFGECCDDDRCSTHIVCPTDDPDCAFCGILDTTCIQGCVPADPDCDESDAEFGSVSGLVLDARDGMPVAGAVVTIADSGQSATTGADGSFLIETVPAGANTIQVQHPDYLAATTPVTVAADRDTPTVVGLVRSMAGTNNITVILSWGAEPSDLDLHVSGPKGGGSRFHVYYSNQDPVTFAFLDLDNTSSFGPETTTITDLGDGTYFAGEYRIWVHNYSSDPGFAASGATVTVFARGRQLAQFTANFASGNSDHDLWRVADLDIQADGSVSVSRTHQTFAEGDENVEF